jgi:hypothetical protein
VDKPEIEIVFNDNACIFKAESSIGGRRATDQWMLIKLQFR